MGRWELVKESFLWILMHLMVDLHCDMEMRLGWPSWSPGELGVCMELICNAMLENISRDH